MDGAPGLEAALTALWGEALRIRRCTIHKHYNLLGHAPRHLHDALTEDCRDMIYADTRAEMQARREAFRKKWRGTCRCIKTQAVLPCAETVAMVFRALLAAGQIRMRKVDGWQTRGQPGEPMPLDQAA